MELNTFIKQYDEFEKNEDIEGAKDLILSIFRDAYVPILQKKLSVNTMLEPCIIKDNGFITIDRYLCHLYFELMLVLLYTDIDIPEAEGQETYKLLYLYDALKSRGIFEILNTYMKEEELDELKLVAESYIKGWLDKNNIVYQLNTTMPKMFERLVQGIVDSSINEDKDENIDAQEKDIIKTEEN